jgi:peptidoglycan/LPS O-acetylase OafA/YrhL
MHRRLAAHQSAIYGEDRFEFLDGLRGVAALAVFISHALESSWPPYYEFLSSRFNLGTWGVFLFFLCSGFIIPVSLERHRSLKRFWIRRVLRLYPLYWLNILLVVLCAIAQTRIFRPALDYRPLGTVLSNLTMLQAFLGYPHLNLIYWTLTVEMVFYMIMSVLFVMRLNTYSVPLAVGLLMATICLALLLPFLFAFSYLTHIVIIFVGAVAYRVHSGQVSGRVGAGVAALTLIMLAAPLFGAAPNRGEQLAVVVSQISAGAFFAGAFMLRGRRPSSVARYLGRISYSIYLMNPIVIALIPEMRSPLQSVLVWCAALLVVASATYRWVERPAIALGQRLTRARV